MFIDGSEYRKIEEKITDHPTKSDDGNELLEDMLEEEIEEHDTKVDTSGTNHNMRKVIAGVAAGQMLSVMGQPADDYMHLARANKFVNPGQPMRPPKRRRGKKRRG